MVSPKLVRASAPRSFLPALSLFVAGLLIGPLGCGFSEGPTTPQVRPELKATPGEVPLQRLSASNLRPTVGEVVTVWVPYGGAWPASIDWKGIDENQGVQATVTPSSAGPLLISAGSIQLELSVQTASNTGTPTLESTARRLPALEHSCKDSRFPMLAGAYAVGCSSSGLVDTAIDLRTGEQHTLQEAVASPGVGVNALHSPDHRQGIWKLPNPVPAGGSAAPRDRVEAPSATDGERAALLLQNHVTFYRPGDSSRRLPDAQPVPWYAPAIAGDWMAWIDDREADWTGRDLWVLAEDDKALPAPLVRDATNPRHVAGRGQWLGWIDDHAIWIEDMNTGERRGVEARSGFRAGLTLWGPVGCWEERLTNRVDINCTDGLEIKEAGWPSRYGPWLLYRRGGRVWLATAITLVLDDDDPRAISTGTRIEGGYRDAHVDGPVSWHFDWPADGWCARPWDNATNQWGAPTPLNVGTNHLTHPQGDAMQLNRSCEIEANVEG